jgi:hypothetical protein
MATTTPNYGWPVPTSTDYVKDGATAIEALGDAIDATVFGLPSGGLTLISATTIGSAVSSVTVTGAFSATYDNYRILVSGGTASTNTGLSLQMGATTSGYKYSLVNAPYNASPAAASSGAGGNILYSAMMTTDGLAGTIDVNSPFLSKRTTFSCVWSSPSETGTTTGHLGNTTSYTAFTLATLSGTVTGGTIRVYGYKN